MNIRFMTDNDIKTVAAIEAASFSMPWSEQAFLESLNMTQALFLVAEKDGGIAGYIGCYLVGDEAEITNVAVARAFRRQGIGDMLLSEVKKIAARRGVKHIFLEVRKNNTAARALYQKTGFCEIGVRKNFYQKPTEDAIVMHFEL